MTRPQPWRIALWDAELQTWLFDPRRFGLVDEAIAQLVFETGEILRGERQENGSWRVFTAHGKEIACIQQLVETSAASPGKPPAQTDRSGPLRRWHGLSWVGWLNYLVLRWFLFRLTYTVEEDNTISGWSMTFHPTWRW